MTRPAGKKFNKAFHKVWKIISEELQVGDLLPTEKELANTLGINRQTVAKALNVLVSEGYVVRRAGAGTHLVRKPAPIEQGCIMVITAGVVNPDTGNGGDMERLFFVINQHALAKGYPPLWLSCQNQHEGPLDIRQLRALYNPQIIRGIIITDAYSSAHKDLMAFLEELTCPIVWTWASPPQTESLNRVDIDDFTATKELVELLISRGCRRIACFSHTPNTIARSDRIKGYKEALTKWRIPVRPELIIEAASDSLMATGRDCAALQIARRLSVDGLFCTDGEVLTGVHEFCREFRRGELQHAPSVTFDLEPESHENLVASVWQPVEDMGRKTIEVLDHLVRGSLNMPVREILPYKIKQATERKL